MAKAAVVAANGGRETPRRGLAQGAADPRLVSRQVAAAIEQLLGAERYAVWFGDGVAIEWEPAAGVNDGGGSLVITAGTPFAQEWLRRTFRGDVEAAARQVCGPLCAVVWRTSAVGGRTMAGAEPEATAPKASAAAAVRSPNTRSTGTSTPATDTPAGEPALALIATRVPAERSESKHLAATPPARRPAASLETFVSGPSNRMAVAAVELAAARPGEISPLVIHGASGVGKSHLLQSLCGRFRELHPEATTVILSAEQFTTGFLQALHGSGLPGFRRACRGADVLVIDDLQFFVGKRATLMEVQQTVDALHRQGRQIVFAADRDPAALDGLGSELIARLQGGIVTRIEPPDYEVRRGIVAGVAVRRGLTLPDDVVHYVATHMTRHARELIGAVNRLEAASLMLGLPITAGVAEEALADLVRSSGRSVRLADVERAICTAFGIEPGSLQSARRARSASHPRMLAMFLARRHTTSALAEIGGYFGRRSHSTVISAQKTVDDWIARRAKVLLADAEWDAEDAIRRVEEILRGG